MNEDFSTTLDSWTDHSDLGAPASIVAVGPTPPAMEVIRPIGNGDGALFDHVPTITSNGLTRLFVTFDVRLDVLNGHDVVFVQLETNPSARTLVRLRNNKQMNVQIEEADAAPAAIPIGTAFTSLGSGFVPVMIDVQFGTLLTVNFNNATPRTFTTFKLAAGGDLKLLFGTFIETTSNTSPATVDIDNVVVCTQN